MSLQNFDISLLQLYRLDLVQSTSNVLIIPALSGTIYFKLLNLTKVFSLIKLYLPSDLLRVFMFQLYSFAWYILLQTSHLYQISRFNEAFSPCLSNIHLQILNLTMASRPPIPERYSSLIPESSQKDMEICPKYTLSAITTIS
jgi:hypothetical protein